MIDVITHFIAFGSGVATWALIGYLVSRNDTQETPVLTKEHIAEAIAKAMEK